MSQLYPPEAGWVVLVHRFFHTVVLGPYKDKETAHRREDFVRSHNQGAAIAVVPVQEFTQKYPLPKDGDTCQYCEVGDLKLPPTEPFGFFSRIPTLTLMPLPTDEDGNVEPLIR